MIDKKTNSWRIVCLLGSILTPSGFVVAQQQAATMLEEVFVTAQKREQSLQDVPMAITALNREAIENSEINNIEELSNLVPSLRFTQGFTGSNTSVRVRGVGTEVQEATVESNVSVVVDGVPLARTELLNFEFADIERIEVLRGPQGTLFGKNSTAGVVQVITRDPAPALEAFARYSVETPDTWPGGQQKAQAGISGPITERLGVRLSAFHKEVDGHLVDVQQGTNPPNRDGYGLRGKLRWEPIDDVILRLILEHSRDDGDSSPFLFRTVNPGRAEREEENIEFDDENRETKTFGVDREDKDNDAILLLADWEIGPGTLSSVTGYREFLFARNQSAPGMTGDRLDLKGSPATRDFTTFTQEFRFTADAFDRLTYTVGVHWFDNEMTEDRRQFAEDIPPSVLAGGLLPVSGLPPLPSPPGGADGLDVKTQYHADIQTRNLGVFGQFTWNFAERWHLTAGARYIREKQSVAGFSNQKIFSSTGTLLVDQGQGPTSGSIGDEDGAGVLSLQYDWDDYSMFYATVARGYRGGAVEFDANTADFEAALEDPVEPETVVNIEFGSKSRLFDNRLELNVSVFHSVFKDFQARVLVLDTDGESPGITLPGTSILTNAGELETSGVEIDFRARPLESLTLSGGFLYNKTEFSEFTNECFPGQQPGESGGMDVDDDGTCDVQDVSGSPLPNAPELSFSISARYEGMLPNNYGRGYAMLSGNWQDDFQFSNTQHPLTKQDAFSIWDLRLGWEGMNDRLEVALYVRNLFDQFYVGGWIPFSFDDDRRDTVHFVPRTANRQYGMTISYSWQ